MPAIHRNSNDTSHLRSSTPIPVDSRRIRVSGRLLCICDTVFIPELGYNGTILDIVGRFVVVLPHDYGPSIRRLPRKLEYGRGISSHIRRWFDRINVAFNDDTILSKGTFPNQTKGKYDKNADSSNVSYSYDLTHAILCFYL